MKKFIAQNWYKLMTGSSLVMASFGFMVYSIIPATAKNLHSIPNSNYNVIPVNSDGTISVKLSDEQLNKIIPKNEDGSINIKLSKQQLQALIPNAVQEIDIREIDGYPVWAGDVGDGSGKALLGVGNP